MSKQYAASLRAGISDTRATPTSDLRPAAREGNETTNYCVADRRGNAVTTTTTLNSLYGLGVWVPGAGFFFNDEMDDFTVQPGTPNQFGRVQSEANAIAPGKRMLSAMAPTIVLDAKGRPPMLVGGRGGPRIITAVVEAIVNVTDEDIPFFLSWSLRASGKVVELMAGTGRVSVPVAAAGVDLTSVDSSPAMLEVLRRKLAREHASARVVQQDVTALDLESRFSLAFIAFNSFEELTADPTREEALRGVFSHLVPGGTFICTLHDPRVRRRRVGPGHEIRHRFRAPATGRQIELSLSTTLEEARALVRGLEVLEDVETGRVILELPICFRLSDEEEFRMLAERSGFHVEALYGDYQGSPYVAGSSSSMVWVLRRPAI